MEIFPYKMLKIVASLPMCVRTRRRGFASEENIFNIKSYCKMCFLKGVFAFIVVVAFSATTGFTNASPVLTAAESPPIQIQSGFEFIGAAEGKIILRPVQATQNLTYQDAIAKCASSGYRILTVESAAQEEILKPHAWTWAWIDGVDFQIPDAFFSLNTGRNLTYFNWVRGRPVIGKDGYNCMRYSQNSIDPPSMWDVGCTDKYTVYCETKV